MIKYLELTPPDSNEFRSAKIVSFAVSEGDSIKTGDTLFVVNSGKDDFNLPSTKDGKVIEIIAVVGETVSIMTPLLLLETEVESSSSSTANTQDENSQNETDQSAIKTEKQTDKAAADIKQEQSPLTTDNNTQVDINSESVGTAMTESSQQIINVEVPDIGGDSAKVIEILVSKGQEVDVDDALVTLESDKASMEVPSTVAGKIESIDVTLDQEVSQGLVIVTISSESSAEPSAESNSEVNKEPEPKPASSEATIEQVTHQEENQASKTVTTPAQQTSSDKNSSSAQKSHASPSIRRFARELGVQLNLVTGTGRKNRVTKEDVKGFVKGVLTNSAPAQNKNSSGAGIPPIPEVDFSRFGETDIQPLNKIKRLTAQNLHRSWLNVPHVTHSDESNIDDLESFRKQLNKESANQENGIKLSPLAFVVKAVVNGLQKFPQFNSSLDSSGDNLIYKKYFNIGIAVETPNGLVVPVLKGVDSMSISDIADEMNTLATKARDKKLSPADMSGACFTISSLGGIGGTSFTPIVNAPEVAILGVSRSKIQPVWNGSEFTPSMILPVSLSYDHRVIDGAEAARFTRHICKMLEDVRLLTI